MNKELIKKLVTSAVNQLIEEQPELLKNNVSERALTHHLANYIAHRVRLNHNYHVDVEYNRLGVSDPKSLSLPPKNKPNEEPTEGRVYPDIIIHHRNTKDNLLVIEIKKCQTDLSKYKLKEDYKRDRQKLMGFLKDERYKYKYGMHIIFFKNGKPCIELIDLVQV